jgi:uncharacterized surface protein with fasciclin (FAS1) repeats
VTKAQASGSVLVEVGKPERDVFAELLADLGITAGELLKNPNPARILTYHILAGEYDAADVVGWVGGTTPRHTPADPKDIRHRGGVVCSATT